MPAGAQLEAEALALAAVPCRPAVMDDRQLLAENDLWEQLGRLVDARRVAFAGEIAWRSREQIGDASLAKRQGARDAADLLAHDLRIGVREARRRTSLGVRVRSRLTLAGEEVPGRWPHVAEALAAGSLGLESAKVIVEMLGAVARRSDPEALEVAEERLVESALELGPELLRVQAEQWQNALDPDGAKPAEEAAHRNRSLQVGEADEDGLTPVRIAAALELTALIKAALASRRRGVQWVREPAEDCDDDTETREVGGDRRTKAQFDHDTLVDVIRAGLRALNEEPGVAPANPAEVVVVVKAEDLEAGRGCGWTDGVTGRISISTVERLQCSGSTRLAVIGEGGEPLYLGKKKRFFSRAQRRLLAVRDGGCAWPGCTAPVAWTEGHHIKWVKRDSGRTDIDNGVLLCSFHHHLIHATDEWEIRVHDRAPHLVPRRWIGDPLPRHRMQRHRLHAANDPPSESPPGRAA